MSEYDRHAAKLYGEGASVQQVANALFAGSAVEARAAIVRAGGTIRKRGRPPSATGLTARNREIYARYDRPGMTMQQVADELKISKQRVGQHVQKVEAYLRQTGTGFYD